MVDRSEDTEWQDDVVDQLERAILIARAAPENLSLAGAHARLIATHLARAWVRLEGADEAILDEGDDWLA